MNISALLLLITLSFGATPQQHAPTAEQCRADAAVWWEHSQPKGTMSDVAFTELSARLSEMYDCMTVDKASSKTYNDAFLMIHSEMGSRWGNFIRRHNLQQEFVKEDAAGMR
jgi:hypothetical protein